MAGINRDFFFERARAALFSRRLKQSQVDGLTAILNGWEDSHSHKDDRWLAYALATAHHETDRTMQPIAEYGAGRGKPYGKVDPATGCAYYGRGFVQLTWAANYRKLGQRLGLGTRLYEEPDLALEISIATEILLIGMDEGRFTGKKLADYFSAAKADWAGARRIVNGTDRARLIADYAREYYAAISYTV